MTDYKSIIESPFYEKANKYVEETGNNDCTLEAYIDGATEATKELQKENAELKENLKTAYRKGMRHMAKALKDYDRTDGAWTDYFEHTVDKVLQREQLDFEEYGTLADQLTKAKKIIQEFLDLNYSEFTKTNAVFLHADKFLKES